MDYFSLVKMVEGLSSGCAGYRSIKNSRDIFAAVLLLWFGDCYSATIFGLY
jgi:hypothetical protein